MMVDYFRKKQEIEDLELEAKEISAEIARRFEEEGIEKDECPLGKFGYRNTKKYTFQAADIEEMDRMKGEAKEFKTEAQERAEVETTKSLVGVKNSK